MRGHNWIQDVLIENVAKLPNAFGVLRENTAVHTLCFLVLSASDRMNKQSRLWISKPIHRTSFWSESNAPADFWCLCIGFFVCRLKTEWPSEWDTPPRLSEWKRARERRWKSRGRNDIRVKRQKTLLNCKSWDFRNRKALNNVRIVWDVPIRKSIFFTGLQLWKIGQKHLSWEHKEKTR